MIPPTQIAYAGKDQIKLSAGTDDEYPLLGMTNYQQIRIG